MKHFGRLLGILALAVSAACTSGVEPSSTPSSTPTSTPPVTEVAPTSTEPPASPSPTSTPTSSPTATPQASGDLEIGQPVSLPEGITLVIGTGCWRCGGQYTTYQAWRAGELTPLYEAPGEVHVSGYVEDPARLLLSVCSPSCHGYEGGHDGTSTVLYDSVDGGRTWRPIGEVSPVSNILGSRGEDVLLVDEDEEVVLFPSGQRVERPSAGRSDRRPLEFEGGPVWETTDRTLIDEHGQVVLEYSSIPSAESISHLERSSGGRFLVAWYGPGASGLAVLDSGRLVFNAPAERFGLPEGVWLDDDRILVSVEYRPGEPLQFAGPESIALSRTPSILDLSTETLHPLEDFFAPDAPRGRNYILTIWRD